MPPTRNKAEKPTSPSKNKDMKPQRVYLDELDASTKAYKVKIKVIEKGRPKISPTKGTVYQSLIMQDAKGNRMRGALFGDQVESYKDAFVYNGTYEIANAPIKRCDPQWKRDPSDLDFQMSFGSDTVIQPVDAANAAKEMLYVPINAIPRTPSVDEKYDTIGLMVYLEPKARLVTTSHNRQTFVREMLIIDQSTEQPVTVSTWNELASIDCEALLPLTAPPPVIGFTALRVSSYKGFSLTTTMSTSLTLAPSGDAAKKIQKWASQNSLTIMAIQARILDVKTVESQRKTENISTLLAKKLSSTLQEERHWLEVSIPEAETHKIYTYVGCSKCGKTTERSLGEKHVCTNCHKNDCVACPRVTFNCDVVDGTGKMGITAFTDHAEQLLGITAPELFKMKQEDNQQEFQKLDKKLAKHRHRIQVGPKGTLSRNNVLQWVLKQVDNETLQSKGALETAQQSLLILTGEGSSTPKAKEQQPIGNAIPTTATETADNPQKHTLPTSHPPAGIKIEKGNQSAEATPTMES